MLWAGPVTRTTLDARHTGAMRVVGLLRGVNLGPSRQLKMADLRAAVESLGHTDVETYLQSGNVVFTPKGRGRDSATAIRAALEETVGLDASVLIRTGEEMAQDRRRRTRTPGGPDEGRRDVPRRRRRRQGRAGARPRRLRARGAHGRGTEIYLHLPGGQGRSKLLAALAR